MDEKERLREYAEKRFKEIEESTQKKVEEMYRKCDAISQTCDHLSSALREHMTPEELRRAEELDRKAEKEEMER